MNEVKKPRKPLMFYYALALLAIILFNGLLAPLLFSPQVTEVDYSAFMQMTVRSMFLRHAWIRWFPPMLAQSDFIRT